MNGDRLLLDTVFIQALFNQRDQYHGRIGIAVNNSPDSF